MVEKKVQPLGLSVTMKRTMIESNHPELSIRRQGYGINRKRVQRLMGLMGLHGVVPEPNEAVQNSVSERLRKILLLSES